MTNDFKNVIRRCRVRACRGPRCSQRFEGYVAKDEGSRYEGGRTRRRLKVNGPGSTVNRPTWIGRPIRMVVPYLATICPLILS